MSAPQHAPRKNGANGRQRTLAAAWTGLALLGATPALASPGVDGALAATDGALAVMDDVALATTTRAIALSAEDEGTVGADIDQRDLRRPPRRDPTEYRSEQYGAFELRFGPYLPNVDDEFGGAATPYEDLFGTSQRYHIGLEVDWQVLRIPHLGTLGPGISFGYTRSSGRAPFTAGGGFSDDRTSLWILPMSAVAVLRVDVLAQRFGVPLVPYGKAGFSYALWSSSGGQGTDRHEGLVGRGAETGYQAAVGLMFWLNVLHPQSALDMDNATGINNSYVFGELLTSDIDSFGQGMQVGTDTWVVGLAFEF